MSYRDRVTEEVVTALNLFQRACLIGSLRNVWFRFLGASNRLLDMKQVTHNMELIGWGYVGFQNIPIERIIGTEETCFEFDSGFFPLRGCCKTRWLQAALECRTDLPPQPVVLTQVNSHYYVQEGIYCISVTRARGRRQVCAYVNRVVLADTKDRLVIPRSSSQDRQEGIDRTWIETPSVEKMEFEDI